MWAFLLKKRGFQWPPLRIRLPKDQSRTAGGASNKICILNSPTPRALQHLLPLNLPDGLWGDGRLRTSHNGCFQIEAIPAEVVNKASQQKKICYLFISLSRSLSFDKIAVQKKRIHNL
ncbi:hypothetical protein GWI33_008555 [Rhynchophorus ferrugineus]|uniref:Uncharacterized protein n=1 Tax=Rhynchophorus ferrugineus TaxID=354439 RepID=A0A834MFV6_RHYFE|nr:hypothetical protein GWI33_008555 [Rhynchophorus ferrugineus]